MQNGLSKKQAEQIIDIFNTNENILEVVLFGSRAKGTFKKGSDIDFCLKGESLNTNDILKLNNIFDETYLPYTFDLVLFHQISNKELIEHINRVGILFYKK